MSVTAEGPSLPETAPFLFARTAKGNTYRHRDRVQCNINCSAPCCILTKKRHGTTALGQIFCRNTRTPQKFTGISGFFFTFRRCSDIII